MLVSLILAISANGVIGDHGKLPWEGELPADMLRFKQLTMGGVVIMGRKTYESLPPEFRPLPGRLNIILTHKTPYWNPDWNPDMEKDLASPCLVVNSLPGALKLATGPMPHPRWRAPLKVFIIGGAKVFEEALRLPEVTRIYLTRVDADFEGGTRIDLDLSEWQLTSSAPHPKDNKNRYDCRFETYSRIAPPQFVNLDNARVLEQVEVMKKIMARGGCPFCQDNLFEYHEQPILRDGRYWLLTYNQWPYDHLRIHLLLITKEHAEKLEDLPADAGFEMLEMCQWAEKKFNIKSGALAIRFGDVLYNGATVRHLHVHIVAGNHEHPDFETVRFKVASRP